MPACDRNAAAYSMQASPTLPHPATAIQGSGQNHPVRTAHILCPGIGVPASRHRHIRYIPPHLASRCTIDGACRPVAQPVASALRRCAKNNAADFLRGVAREVAEAIHPEPYRKPPPSLQPSPLKREEVSLLHPCAPTHPAVRLPLQSVARCAPGYRGKPEIFHPATASRDAARSCADSYRQRCFHLLSSSTDALPHNRESLAASSATAGARNWEAPYAQQITAASAGSGQ